MVILFLIVISMEWKPLHLLNIGRQSCLANMSFLYT